MKQKKNTVYSLLPKIMKRIRFLQLSSNSRSFDVKSEVGIEFNPFYMFC